MHLVPVKSSFRNSIQNEYVAGSDVKIASKDFLLTRGWGKKNKMETTADSDRLKEDVAGLNIKNKM